MASSPGRGDEQSTGWSSETPRPSPSSPTDSFNFNKPGPYRSWIRISARKGPCVRGDHPSRGEDVRMGSRRFQERFGSCSLYSRPCRKSRDRLVGCAPARPPAPCSPPSSWLGPHPFTRTHRPLRCPDRSQQELERATASK